MSFLLQRPRDFPQRMRAKVIFHIPLLLSCQLLSLLHSRTSLQQLLFAADGGS